MGDIRACRSRWTTWTPEVGKHRRLSATTNFGITARQKRISDGRLPHELELRARAGATICSGDGMYFGTRHVLGGALRQSRALRPPALDAIISGNPGSTRRKDFRWTICFETGKTDLPRTREKRSVTWL